MKENPTKVRKGANTTVDYTVLASPVAFECLVGGTHFSLSSMTNGTSVEYPFPLQFHQERLIE